ncbi:MAG TPA: hypothetical protein VJ850_08805 [Candidatus Limnocylindrales bacterium]|nr:hypothetical protein [Candidatus Limnocylindrales bacterium]
MPVRTFCPRRPVPSIPGASTTRGGIVLASARLRAAPSRSSASRTSSRAAPSRAPGKGYTPPQHDTASPKQQDPQSELDAVLDLQQAYGNQAVVQLLASGGHGSPPPVLPPRWQMGNRAVAQLLNAQRAPGDGPTFGNLKPEDTHNEDAITFKLENIGGQWWEVRPPGSGVQRRPARGTYNFVVKGDTIHAHRSFGHVQLARGERVTMAGEIHFASPGILGTWTNDSGHTRASSTFAAGDRMRVARLGLEEANFVPEPPSGKPRAQLPVWPQGAEPTPIPRAKPKPASGADDADGADEQALPARPVLTSWEGKKVDSDLPKEADGSVAPPKFSTGKGVPKPGSQVEAEDAAVSAGVGTMYAKKSRGDLKTIGQPGEGMSTSYILQDQKTKQKFLFKPIVGEKVVPTAHARGVAAGHYAERARAGSIAAKALGIDTPEVELVEFQGRKGSLTPWVEGKAGSQVMSLAEYAGQDPQRFYDLQDTPAFRKAIGSIQALDYLINNVDRVSNTGNYLIELDENHQFKSLIPIDQELAFTHTSDRAIIQDKTGSFPKVWTKELAEKVAKLHENPTEFIAKIRPLVGDAAVAGVLSRLNELYGHGVMRGVIKPGTPGSPAGGAASGQGGSEQTLPAQPAETPIADDEPVPAHRAAKQQLPAQPAETPIADDEPAAGHGGGKQQTLPAQPAETPIADDEPAAAPVRGATAGASAPAASAVGGEAASPTGASPSTPSTGHATPATTHATPAVDPADAVSLPGGPVTETKKQGKFQKNPLKAFKTKDASLGGYHTESKTVTTHGQDEHGEDITSSNESKGNVDVNLKGVEFGKNVSHTTKKGNKVGAGASGSVDWDGNTNLVGSATFETRSGLSISPSVGRSDQADASDPQYIEGTGFVVTYKRSTTDNYGVGGGKSLGGGTSASINVGHSEAKYRSGSRIFKTLDEANAFRDNVRRETEESIFQAPPTTVMGALQIKQGESRGGGTASANTIGGSLSYGDGLGDLGYSHVETTNNEVSVMRTGPTTVDVTRTFSEDTTKDPKIGAFGASNTKGTSEETGRAVTYTFDLATPAGIEAFNKWVAKPDPPGAGATNRRTKSFKQTNHHDDYGFPVKFSASWKDRGWESKEEDEAGNVTETFGGGQDRDIRTGRISEALGDKELHANAQIEATIRNGQESYAARFTASGKSGDSNLEELGKMFMGAHHDAGASSGYWLLTAEIDPLVVKELEQNSRAFRNAKTPQDRMRIYRDFARENGARMISGQVRGGGKPNAWNLELPGDPNFPGASGRAALDDKQKASREQLGTDHKSGAAVAESAKQEITKLKDRRAAVADTKRYTDLPDELRQEQVNLVDDHIAKFEGVRSQSNSLAMRNDPNEEIGSIRARVEADEKKAPAKAKTAGTTAAKPGRKKPPKAPAPSADQIAAEAKMPPDQKEIKKLSDRVAVKESDIATASGKVSAANHVLGKMMKNGQVRYGDGVKGSVWSKYNAEAKEHLANAQRWDANLRASAQKARDLRNQWQEAKDDPARLVALRALDAELEQQRGWVDLELEAIRDATRKAYIVTSDKGIGENWQYCMAIKCDAESRTNALNTQSGFASEDDV